MSVLTPQLTPLFFFVFVWSVFAGLVVERVIHAAAYLLISTIAVGGGAITSVKRLATMEVLKEGISGILESFTGLLQAAGIFCGTIVTSWFFILSVIIVIFVTTLMQTESSGLIVAFVRLYNSDVSTTVRSNFLVTTQYGERFLQPILFIWNAFAFVWKLIKTEVILPILMNSTDLVAGLAGSLGQLARSSSMSIVSFIQRLNTNDCSVDRLLSSAQVQNGTLPCFVPGRRSLDLITPLADVRLVAMYLVLILKNSCNVLSPPFDLAVYPLLDMNFAKGVHNIVNAFIYWFVNMPIMTISRCKAVSKGDNPPYPEGHWMRLVMCTPDMTPGFSYLIAGVRRFGELIDNWLNATWLVLLGALNLEIPTCAPIPLSMEANIKQHLFGGNETRVVGLTNGAYAQTDGSSVHYTFFLGQITTVFSPAAWQGEIVVRFGVAAIMYDSGDESIDAMSGQQTMSMMGCQCLDVPDPTGYLFDDGFMTRMQIDCSILTYDPGSVGLDGETRDTSAPHYVPVAFAVPAAALYMRCATTKIVVDSARFPLSRLGLYEDAKAKNYDDPIDGQFTRPDGVDQPEEVDAVVWVIPSCDAEGFSPACQSRMSDSGCFPYCMAARKRGSRNNGLTLYSKNDWENHVQLQDRDCSAEVAVDTPNAVVEYTGDRSSPAYYTYKGVTYSNLDILNGQWVFSQSWDPVAQACSYNPTTNSRIARGTAITNGSSIEMYGYDDYHALLADSQPFAVAGETALTLVMRKAKNEFERDTYAILVQRLYGQQGTGFVGLVTVNSQLPARKPCKTPASCGDAVNGYGDSQQNIAVIPYSVFSDPSLHNPAVMTKWAVVYAANPSYEMFSQLDRFCKDKATDLEIQLLSSFGAVRLWRVDAFAYDDPAGVRATKTGAYVEIPDGFKSTSSVSDCSRIFNVRVTSIEYLNDYNIAVQVLRASLNSFNVITREFDINRNRGPKGESLMTFVTFFLNPVTMKIREDIMWEESDAASVLGQGLLCPSQRRMPDWGSMVAEIIAAGLHATRMFMEILLTGPAVFTPGSFKTIQTMYMPINYGHSFILNQGMGWLNFDPFFESIRRSHQHFWNTFVKISSLFDTSPYIHQFMNGLAMYAQDYTPMVTANMKMYLGVGGEISSVVDTQLVDMAETVGGQRPTAFAGFAASAGMINTGQYATRMLRIMVVNIILPAIDAAASGTGGEMIVHGLWQVVYDSKQEYQSLILAAEMRSCAGLQLMIGQTNPFGRMAGAICYSSIQFKSGVIETALTFFVDLPMLSCLCTDSEQKDYRKWAMDHCYAAAPTHFRGPVRALIDGSTDIPTLCSTASNEVQIKIRDAMDPFLAASLKSSAILADVVDYLRYTWDKTAGSCRDYAGDPSVVAIIPDPIEFWRVCAWTKSCKAKCLPSITAFESTKDSHGVTIRDVRRVTSQTTIQSSFFSDMDIISGRAKAPFDILEMSEMIDCSYTCDNGDLMNRDRCVAVLGIEYGAVSDPDQDMSMVGSVVVAEYCVPTRLDAHVWLARTWRVAGSENWVGGIQQIRLHHQGGLQCRGSTGAFCSVAVLSENKVSFYREDGDEYVVQRFSLAASRVSGISNVVRIVSFGNSALIISGQGFVNSVDSKRVPRSACVQTGFSDGNKWGSFPVTECDQNVLDETIQEIPVCIFNSNGICGQVLLIPTTDERPVLLCEFEFEDGELPGLLRGRITKREECQEFPLTTGAIKEAGLYQYLTVPLMGAFTTTTQQRRSTIVLSSTMSEVALRTLATTKDYNVLVANHPKRHINWLATLRLDTRVQSLAFHGSIPVPMVVEIIHACDVTDCTGCIGRTIQTLCYAAQQCTIANCIGTTVNLNKPLCAIGEVLADGVEALLLAWRAGWSTMSTMIIQTIAIASTGKSSADSVTDVVDELFSSSICLQKDAIFDVAGTVTSFLNANINMIENLLATGGDVGSLFNAPKISNVEEFVSSEYAEAKRTMVLAAVTRFLGNIGLGAVYPLLVARKMMLCQGNDIMSVFNIGGMKLTVGSVKYSTLYNEMVGRCMTSFESDNVQDGNSDGINSALDGILAWLGTVPYANYKHVIDGGLSYVMGLIRGIQDMVQTADIQHCKLTDAGVFLQGQCACGDDPVVIPDKQAKATISDSSYWCSGLLRMETPFGTPLFVYNPYSYDYLRSAASGTGAYMRCLSLEETGSCGHLEPPAPPILKKQGAKLLAVLTRCNANYQAMQWDTGAAKLYNDPSLLEGYLLDFEAAIRADREVAMKDTVVATCMSDAFAYSLPNDGCLALHLAKSTIGLRREDFFSYAAPDEDTLVDGNLPTEKIAACIVFSGPSKSQRVGIAESLEFRLCTDPDNTVSDDGSACQLQSYIWSSKSRNAIPVANLHALGNIAQSKLQNKAMAAYQRISDQVMKIILEAQVKWNKDDGSQLLAQLFTAEGDLLHQAFDCMFIGPYGRADLSPRDVSEVLPALEYFRDKQGGDTRDFVLPCSGDELKGDEESPYTCGSDVRRSVIKSFVRQGIAGEDKNYFVSQVVIAVNQLLVRAREVFESISDFGCACKDGSKFAFDVSCCADLIKGKDTDLSFSMYLRSASGSEKRQMLSFFLPPTITKLNFAQLEHTNLAESLLDAAFEFMETSVWNDIGVSTSYGINHDDYLISEQQREIAALEGLYTTTKPLTSYGKDEAFDEITKFSAFDICIGAVSQVMFTIPVGDPVTGAPTTASSLDAWDPTQSAPSAHFTALEAWVHRLVSDAREKSPLFWSHRLKHVASDSNVCVDSFLANATRTARNASLNTSVYDDMSSSPAKWDNATHSQEGHALLAASVVPGPTRGVFESLVAAVDFSPPESLMDQDGHRVFRETQRSTWALGQVITTCFCGWDNIEDADGRTWCKVPDSVCSLHRESSTLIMRICSMQSGMYWHHWKNSADGLAMGKLMFAYAQQLTPDQCPFNMVDSSAWGLLDEEVFVPQWLLSGEFNESTEEYGATGGSSGDPARKFTSKHLLYEGRGGIRYMNSEKVLTRGRDSPFHLFNPLEMASSVAQHHCESNPMHASSTIINTSYSDHFRDVLFPVVQGVPENRATSFCLRYIVELATFTALRHILSPDHHEVTTQEGILAIWNRKCHTQTKLLGFCALRNVFASHRVRSVPVLSTGVLKNHEACLGIVFTGTVPVGNSFTVVGASCIAVYHKVTNGVAEVLIFDPCRVHSTCVFAGERQRYANASSGAPSSYTESDDPTETYTVESIDITGFLVNNPKGSLATLDATSFLNEHSKSMSLKWSKKDDPHWKVIQAERDLYHEKRESTQFQPDVIGLNIENLWQQYVRPEPTASRQAWHTESGPRAAEDGANCGGISDWWPEEWEHPVGFHVTAPCGGGNVAYRTFNNHFEYDEETHSMNYQHSKLRNETLMMNNAGGSGMCRLNTVGQLMREQNNVRVCTRMRNGVTVDYSVPVLQDPSVGTTTPRTWTEEHCSTSSEHVPWKSASTTQARHRSSGLLPSWPQDEDVTWPSHDSDLLGLGVSENSNPDSWNDGDGMCGMPEQFICRDDAHCKQYTVGLQSDTVFTCMSGICMVTGVGVLRAEKEIPWTGSDNFIECTTHAHCAAPLEEGGLNRPDLLCSGEGRCVMPVIEIRNEFGEDVDMSWHGSSCDENSMDTVDMYGKSPWGRVTGLYEAHGLCSHRNWYEYRNVFDRQCKLGRSDSDTANMICTLNDNAAWIDTSLEYDIQADNIFTKQEILYQEAHRCDRDFQHFQGKVMCRPRMHTPAKPSRARLQTSNGFNTPIARYSPLYQTYYRDENIAYDQETVKHSVKIAEMEFSENANLGFLGTSQEDFGALGLEPCVDIPQCSLPNYNIQSTPIAKRMVHRGQLIGNSLYKMQDAITCGSFGYIGKTDQGATLCFVDWAVVPLAYLLVHRYSRLQQAGCNANPTLGNTRNKLMDLISGGYVDREKVRGWLNSVLDDIFQADFETLAAYNDRMRCAQYISFSMRAGVLYEYDREDVGVDTALEKTISFAPERLSQTYEILTESQLSDEGSNSTAPPIGVETITRHSDRVLNYFTEFSMAEVAPMWWIKCYLLSNIKPSATGSVVCPAWDRWLASQLSTFNTVPPSITMKEWLQQTASVLKNIDGLQAAAAITVRTVGNMAVSNATAFLLQPDQANTPDLQPTCHDSRTFNVLDPVNREAFPGSPIGRMKLSFQNMIYSLYKSGQSVIVDRYTESCERIAGCTTSNGAQKEPVGASGTEGLFAVAKDWMFGQQGYGALTAWLTDAEILQQRIPDSPNPEIALFSQPWLHMDHVGYDIADTLKQEVHDAFPAVDNDECVVWAMQDKVFQTLSENMGCIYSNRPESDPIGANDAESQDYSAVINLWHGAGNRKEGDPEQQFVCASSDIKDETLGVRCNLDRNGPAFTPYETGFKCSGADRATGCIDIGWLQNPSPQRRCYEMGNTCYNKWRSPEFANTRSHRWNHAILPPGVKLITYAYAPEPDIIIGRNPRYLTKYQKLVWNNTFFPRDVSEARRVALKKLEGYPAIPKIYAGFVKDDQLYASRRLLQTTSNNGGEVSPESFSVPANHTDGVSGNSRALLEKMAWNWWDKDNCYMRRIKKIDASRGNYACIADGGKDDECCSCKADDFEVYNGWIWIDRVANMFLWNLVPPYKLNACAGCPTGYKRKREGMKNNGDTWDKVSSLEWPCEKDTGGDGVGATPAPEEICTIDNPIWPPVLSWRETSGGSNGGKGADVAGSFTKEFVETCDKCATKNCEYHTTLTTYQQDEPYPPWYNCNLNPRLDAPSALPAGAHKGIPGSIRTILKSIQERVYRSDTNTKRARNLFSKHYRDTGDHFLDYDEGPTYQSGQAMAGSKFMEVEVALPANYDSLSLELMPGFTCNRDRCSGLAKEIRTGYYFCQDCSKFAPNYEFCTGKHGCHIAAAQTKISNAFVSSDFVPSWQLSKMNALISKRGPQMNVMDVTHLIVHFIQQFYRKIFLNAQSVLRNTDTPGSMHMRIKAESLVVKLSNYLAMDHPSHWDYKTYSPHLAINWQEITGKKEGIGPDAKIKIEKCLDVGTQETASVNYQSCSNNEHLIALRDRANVAYNKTGPLIIPHGYKVQLPVSADLLVGDKSGGAGTVLLSWAKSQRDRREKHFEYLLGLAHLCDETSIWQSVCRVNALDASKIELFNPWTGGGFEARGGCDIGKTTVENGAVDVIDTLCVNAMECNMQTESVPFYREQVGGCRQRDGQWAAKRIVAKSERSNVCFLKPTSSGHATTGKCEHLQGLLGGGAGREGAGQPHENLYKYALDPSIGNYESGGLFVRPQRQIFRAASFTEEDVGIDKNLLHLDQGDIGGHQMHFVVTSEGLLQLYDVVLAGRVNDDSTPGPAHAVGTGATSRLAEHEALRRADVPVDGTTLHDWLSWDIGHEHTNATLHEPDLPVGDSANLHWACPMKQRLYLSGQAGSHFRPMLPNPRRSAIIFAKHSINMKRSSSVQKYGMASAYIESSSIRSSNGFCFCESIDDCRLPLGSVMPCSLKQSFEALRMNSDRWFSSKVLSAQRRSQCVEQLDWPYTGGTLRDGSYIGGTSVPVPRKSSCNLLTRIHDFEYKYMTKPPSVERVPRNSQVPGGDCFTGTARRKTATTQETKEYKWNPFDRRSCQSSSCKAPPSFRAGVNNEEIPAESSFGVLYRQSAEQAIAGNLREKLRLSLCTASDRAESDSSCEALDRILNVSSWVSPNFWPAFLDDVTNLFTKNATNHSGEILNDDPVRMSARQLLDAASVVLDINVTAAEVAMWDRPWVFCERIDPTCVDDCNDVTNVCTRSCSYDGSSVGTCHGSIPKTTWNNPALRAGACKASLKETTEDERVTTISPINVCDLDSTMNELCVAIQGAKSKIFEENCKASGVCFEEEFFYVPGLYSSANQEFVQATVETFYKSISGNSCPIASVREEAVLASNEASVQNCASTQLQIVHDLLRGLRKIVDTIMRISYFWGMVQINLARFLFMALDPHAMGQVQMYWELLLREMGTLWTQLGDLIFKLMFDSGFGKALQTFLDWLCWFVDFMYRNIWLGFVCPLLKKVGTFMVDFDILGAKPLEIVGRNLLEFHRTDCYYKGEPCKGLVMPPEDPLPTALPVPTRCWSTYSTFLGDANSLSCSAADTCMANDISELYGDVADTSQVAGIKVCDSCAATESTSFSRYGCDIVTKTCKCGVQSVLRTTCITNDECAFAGATCDIVDNFFERDQFGSIGCQECSTDRICLVSPGDSVGHCSCSTTPVTYSSCPATSHGQLVFTPAYTMCMVALGASAQNELRSDSSYRIESSKLATARCDMLDSAQRYCVSVEFGPSTTSTFAVGLENLFSRRLLQIGDSNSSSAGFFRFIVPAEAYELALNADWSTVHTEVCRHVPRLLLDVQEGGIPMSLSDTELLKSCVRWRAIGIEIVFSTNTSSFIPDTFLVGSLDFAYEVVAHPSRFYAIVQRPWVFIRAVMHTEYMAPVRVIVRDLHRWWLHAHIEAFSSANMLASQIQEGKDVDGKYSSNITSRARMHNNTLAVADYANGMSKHLTNSAWSYIFGTKRGYGAHAPKQHHLRDLRDRQEYNPLYPKAHLTTHENHTHRYAQNHAIAFSHSILHTPEVSPHWLRNRKGENESHHYPRFHQSLHEIGGFKKNHNQAKKKNNLVLVGPQQHSKNTNNMEYVKSTNKKNSGHDTAKHSRGLKEVIDESFIARMNAVQQYSSDVALGEGVVQLLPKSVTDQFVRGPMLWPPTYVYWNTGDTCALATNLLSAAVKATDAMKRVYKEDETVRRPPVSHDPFQVFRDTWNYGEALAMQRELQKREEELEESYVVDQSPPKSNFAKYLEKSAPWYIRAPLQFVISNTGFSEKPILNFVYEVPQVLTGLLRCDVEEQLFCTGHHYSIITSSIIAVIILGALHSLFTFTGIPVVTVMLQGLSFGAIVMFISFNYSPFCAPLIPSCFFESLVGDIVYWFPPKVQIPQSLVTCEWDQTESVPPSRCLVQCAEPPFSFDDYSSNLAWMVCQLSTPYCESMQSYFGSSGTIFSIIMGAEASSVNERSFYRSRIVLNSGDQNMIDGFGWCNTLTLYQLIPVLVAVLFCFTAIPLILAVILRACILLLRTAFSAYAMTHV